MTSLTFYGGVDEIGGNKTLLEDEGTRILLDFGMSFKQAGMYFSEFLQPRKCNCFLDFQVTGLLPKLHGIYRSDYLRHLGQPEEERSVDGVLLSHAHADHAAYIHHIRRDIPLYMSPETYAIIRTLEETGSSSFSDLTRYRENFAIRPKKRGEGFTKVKGEDAETLRSIELLESGKKFEIGSLEITPFRVDHSLPGASAYLIHASEGSILYTGDFRFHGYRGDETVRMFEAASEEGVDAVITEGTRVSEGPGTTEADVLKFASRKVSESQGLVVVNFPQRDLDRMMTFHNVARRTGRKLVLSLKHAYLLEQLAELGSDYPSLIDGNLAFYAERKGWGLIGREDYPSSMIGQDYRIWERKYLDQENTVNYRDVKENQKDYMFYCSYFQVNELIDVMPEQGSLWIRSVTEPFNEEMEIDAKRVENWLNLFGLELVGMDPEHPIHASGHASGPEIFESLERLRPKVIYPIHTEHAEIFSERFEQTVIVKKGIEYTL